MSDKPQAAQVSICESQESMNWKQCILCQSHDDKEEVVRNPRIDSYQRVLDRVGDRASLGDGKYVEVQRRLQFYTNDALCTHQAIYHRSCYANATNSNRIQRSRDHYAHALATGRYTAKKRGQ